MRAEAHFKILKEVSGGPAALKIDCAVPHYDQCACQESEKVVFRTTIQSLTVYVQFPMMAKVEVNGSNADPFYSFLKSKQGGIIVSEIKW